MSYPSVGQPFTLLYTPTVNGQAMDLLAGGGSVTNLKIYDTDGTTILANVGPATRTGVAQYQFNVTAINKAGTFAAVVQYIPATGAQTVTDSNQRVTVYAFSGTQTPPFTAMNGQWNYTADPSTSDKDAVRFLLGDTDPSDPMITDGVIAYLLTTWVNVYSAAAAGAEQIAGQYVRETVYQGDGVGVDFSTLQQKFMLLAGQIRTLGKRYGRAAVPYVGGMLRSENATAFANTDVAPGLFAVGMHDDYREGGAANYSPSLLKSDQQYGGAST